MHASLQEAGIATEGEGDGAKVYQDCEELGPDVLTKDVVAVVCGLDTQFNYYKICKAANLIRYRNCEFVATNQDAVAPLLGSGGLVPSGGSMVGAVEVASGVKPICVGKPSADLAALVVKLYGLDPARTCMVGDRLDTDIQFGHNGGMKTLLVMSGVTQEEQAEELVAGTAPEGTAVPTFIAASVATLLE